MKVNLLQNGGDKQIRCDLNLLEDDGAHEPRPLNHRGWTTQKLRNHRGLTNREESYCFIRNSFACRVFAEYWGWCADVGRLAVLGPAGPSMASVS